MTTEKKLLLKKIKKILVIMFVIDLKELKKIIKDTAYSPSYQMAIKTSKLITLVGWTLALISVVFFLFLLISGGFKLFVMPFVIMVFMFGLLLAIAGQSSVAIMNNANYSKQILTELKKQNISSLEAKTS